MVSDVIGELRPNGSQTPVSNLAASIARLHAKYADKLNTSGGSPMAFAPSIPFGFGLFSRNDTRKSIGMSLRNGGK